MTHPFQRSALILLAGTAFSVVPMAQGAVAQPVLDIPPAAAPSPSMPAVAVAAPGVDAASRSKSRRKSSGPAATYKVRKGDTLAEVADKLNVTVEDLARANGLRKPYRIDVGDILKNPKVAKESAKGGGGSKKASGGRSGGESYVVKSGDTLFSISKRFGVSIDALKSANGLGRSSSLARGRKLTIPGTGGPADSVEDEAAAPEPRAGRGRATAEPQAEVEERAAAPGRVITIQTAGKAYRVRKGDNLAKVAAKLGADQDDLIRLNKLKRPYRLRAGQTLRGPGASAKAYVVARGDTLASVAERFDVTVDRLRQTNGLRRGAALSPGRQLRLPAGYRDRGAGARMPEREPESSFRNPPPVGQTLPPPRSAQEGLPSGPQPYNPNPRRPQSSYPVPGGGVSGAPTAAPAISDAQIMQMGRGLFAWPLKGTVISGFGDKGTSQRNDGINIRANAGDSVRAAASGDVVYAGDQVPGFGNLVLIKHADGWVTAYGHLGKVGVRMQQKVTQGQEIGEAGSTGGVSEPQLHFEVRYAPNPQERARPVDPALVLPK